MHINTTNSGDKPSDANPELAAISGDDRAISELNDSPMTTSENTPTDNCADSSSVSPGNAGPVNNDEAVRKALIKSGQTPILADVLASLGMVGVLVFAIAGMHWTLRVAALILLFVGLIGQTRYSGSAAVRSNLYISVGVFGCIIGFALSALIIPKVVARFPQVWMPWLLLVVFTLISVAIFRGIRLGTLWWIHRDKSGLPAGNDNGADESNPVAGSKPIHNSEDSDSNKDKADEGHPLQVAIADSSAPAPDLASGPDLAPAPDAAPAPDSAKDATQQD